MRPESWWQELENSYLSHVLSFLRARDPNARTLRTFLDSWFAYHSRDEGLIDTAGAHRWLNVGDLNPADCHAKLGSVHAISESAERLLRRGKDGDPEVLSAWERDKKAHGLAKDHVFPLRQLCSELRSGSFAGKSELRVFLIKHYRVAIITQAEHKSLSGRARHSMPDGWNNIFQRYNDADIAFRIGGWRKNSGDAVPGI